MKPASTEARFPRTPWRVLWRGIWMAAMLPVLLAMILVGIELLIILRDESGTVFQSGEWALLPVIAAMMLVVLLPSATVGGATVACIVYWLTQRGGWIGSWKLIVIGASVGALSGVGAIETAYLLTDDWYLSIVEWAVVLSMCATVGAAHASLMARYLNTARS